RRRDHGDRRRARRRARDRPLPPLSLARRRDRIGRRDRRAGLTVSRYHGMGRSARHRVFAVLSAVVLAVGVAAAPAAQGEPPTEPSAVVAGKKPPRCKVADDLTRFRRLNHYDRTLLDHALRFPRSYAPKVLVPVSRAKVAGTGSIRELIVKDLRAMGKAARKAGAAFAVRSAYRSYATQKATFARWQRELGYAAALRTSARAGHSEHQL